MRHLVSSFHVFDEGPLQGIGSVYVDPHIFLERVVRKLIIVKDCNANKKCALEHADVPSLLEEFITSILRS